MRQNIILIIVFLILSFKIYGQDYIKGKVIEIVDVNSFKIISKGNIKSVIIYETVVNAKLREKGIIYLKNTIYNKDICIHIDELTDNDIFGSILYNCVTSDDFILDDIPCIKANNLNIELIKLGYLKYTGNNKFLLKLK